jgi:hypothetical protein
MLKALLSLSTNEYYIELFIITELFLVSTIIEVYLTDLNSEECKLKTEAW